MNANSYNFQNLANNEEKKSENLENSNKNPNPKESEKNQQKAPEYEEDDQFYYDAEREAEIEDFMEYFEKLKNCECCKGNFYSCQGQVCESLGACYCYTKLKLEEEAS
jgi:hypothetical protein